MLVVRAHCLTANLALFLSSVSVCYVLAPFIDLDNNNMIKTSYRNLNELYFK